MPYKTKKSKRDHDYAAALKGKNVPLLVLDQKWYRIFNGTEKPADIESLEGQLNELIQKQSRVQQELKELKKLKNTLMHNIVENMEGAEQPDPDNPMARKLAEDKRLIEEINEKMGSCEDILLELPQQIHETNGLLMQATMRFCYDRLRVNEVDIEETGEWIKNIRIELKKQIIRKQNAEITNKEIYAYMHDIFGPQITDVFDLKYEAK